MNPHTTYGEAIARFLNEPTPANKQAMLDAGTALAIRGHSRSEGAGGWGGGKMSNPALDPQEAFAAYENRIRELEWALETSRALCDEIRKSSLKWQVRCEQLEHEAHFYGITAVLPAREG